MPTSSLLLSTFGEPLYLAAEQLVTGGAVLDARVLQNGAVVTGVVTPRHRVYIRRANGKIDGECSCTERSPCAHIVAVAIAAERATPAAPVPRPMVGPATSPTQRLLYLLTESSVSAWVAQGDTLHPFAVRGTDYPRYVQPNDREILEALTIDRLRRIVATGRAYWQALRGGQPLRGGPTRSVGFVWHPRPNGDQELRCEAAGLNVFLELDPPLYLDAAAAEVGLLESVQPLGLVRRYWRQTPVPPERVEETNARIANESPPHRVGGAVSGPAASTGPVAFPALHRFPVAARPLSSLTPKLALSSDAALFFVYNNLPVDSTRLRDPSATVRQLWDGVLYEIPRDFTREQQWRAQLTAMLPTGADREPWLRFVLHDVPTLRAAGWEVAIDDTFPYRIARTDQWYGDVDSDRRQGWFNLRLGVMVDGKPVNLLPALAHYLQTTLAGGQTSLAAEPTASQLPEGNSGCRVGDQWLIRLDDGRYLPIAIERIQRIAHTLVELFDRDGLTAQQALSLPVSQTTRIAQLSRELSGPVLRTTAPDLRSLLEDLESSGGTGIRPMPASPNFRARLRPYQEEGLGWLQFLRKHHLGGILADDMGLGKTVQTLSHLLLEKEQGRLRKPALIVAPVSTLGNWLQELHRFAPQLNGLVLHGNRRRESFALIGKMDVVITGYPLLQLDSETLLAHAFYLIILDEAQTIKNPRAKVSLMARSLRAEHRLALTGTPVENHLGELWSLFDFAQPGLLGEERHFQRHYRTPIEKDGQRTRAQALAQRVAPFLLRRTKDAVAQDLPPKTEIVETVALDERQRDFYDGIRLAGHRHIQDVIRQQGLARSQITILDALLKLRQACCDPRLLGAAAEREAVPSAKLEWLTTALPELIAEGRRVLLFSQFTSMLSLIEQAVTALEIPYCLLTGATQNRSHVVARFQSGAVPLFLISLKAGGTGLNLTAADTVIHYDPWWNPAVEAQATDRAHRIGQDKPVFVYKLIAQDTVEERILQLQADKHALASRLYTESTGTPASLTTADIEALFAP